MSLLAINVVGNLNEVQLNFSNKFQKESCMREIDGFVGYIEIKIN